MEMLCLIHEADPSGSLLVKGKPISDKQLAMLVGRHVEKIGCLLSELEDAGVFSRDNDVKDECLGPSVRLGGTGPAAGRQP
jgi:predicted transcriptional regulator